MIADVVVIGGGPAGMAAALEAEKTGASVVLCERDNCLGGILNQCIHPGFGLHHFGEEMTGPEYAEKFEKQVKKSHINVLLETFVTKVKSGKVEIISSKGAEEIVCKSVVLAMGCRERTAGAIALTGTRPAGIYTAGQVQKLVNMYGKLPFKKPVILGSGDIGLIMARRMTFEGAKPLMVLEIMQSTSGLARNICQCLEDFNIPLFLSTTIVDVVGKKRVEGVVIAKVDEKGQVIDSSKKLVKCDGVILSVGLIPENDLVPSLVFNPRTSGAVVNEYHETSMKGVFSCGNVLHVHDLVDYVTKESLLVGNFAGLNALGKLRRGKEYKISCGAGVRYTVPSSLFAGKGTTLVMFRVDKKYVKTNIVVTCGGEEIAKKFVLSANAGEMQEIEVPKDKITQDVIIFMGGAL